MKASDVAVVVGHFNMPGAVALNLHLLRKHNPPEHPILVTDDVSEPDAVQRLVVECEKYNATLRAGSTRHGHVGGDLRAFYYGLLFAKERNCKFLMKLSQRAVFDIPRWLMSSAHALEAWGYPCAGQRAAVGNNQTLAHCRTSSILLKVSDWTQPHILEHLKPQRHGGISCEWLIGTLLQQLGGTMLSLPFVPANLLTSAVDGTGQVVSPWHDDPESGPHYQRIADREGIDLGPEFHVRGINTLPDGTADPTYYP